MLLWSSQPFFPLINLKSSVHPRFLGIKPLILFPSSFSASSTRAWHPSISNQSKWLEVHQVTCSLTSHIFLPLTCAVSMAWKADPLFLSTWPAFICSSWLVQSLTPFEVFLTPADKIGGVYSNLYVCLLLPCMTIVYMSFFLTLDCDLGQDVFIIHLCVTTA